MANSEPITSTHLHALGSKMGFPASGTFELTARCNFDCRMCYVHLKNDVHELKKKELTAEQWLDIARHAKDMGLLFLLLTGGEPFLREDFPYLYTELVKMGFVVSINTNASLYNDELSELFAKYPPSRINVTLYGGRDTYASLCGNPSFDKVVANLRRMKSEGLQVRLNVSLTPHNVEDMELIDSISREIGLQAKASAYMYPPVRVNGCIGENAARFDAEEAGQVISRWYSLRESKDAFAARAEALKQGLEQSIESECADEEGSPIQCRAGKSSFWLTWDGKMMPCGTMNVDGPYPLQIGFKSAWEETLKYTAAIRLPPECSACPRRQGCGVCASICKAETGRFDGKPEYMCAMAKARAEEIIRIAEHNGGRDEDKA